LSPSEKKKKLNGGVAILLKKNRLPKTLKG
jgi:hypothetical protein